jgi:HEAT repeat protein
MNKKFLGPGIGRLLAFFGLATLAACAATNQTFDASNLPTQAEITAELAQASMPNELREQIIRLYSRDPKQRAQAASHLGKMAMGAGPAVPYLIRLLRDNTPVQVSHYLGGGYTSSVETTPSEEASHALAEIGDPATNALLLALQDPHADVRRLAAKALGQVGEIGAVDFLIKLLDDPDRGVRATAAIALGNYRHPMAAQKIMDAYAAGASVAARTDMIFALAHINDVLAVPFLMARANDPVTDIRAAVMLALGKLRDARVIPTLLNGIKDSDEITRANAAYALGAYFSPAVVDALITALADTASRVRQAAAESLTGMTGMNFGVDQSKWQAWWREQRKQMQPAQKTGE